MPFPSEMTGGQVTQVRQPNQRFRQSLLICPNTLIWQTQPSIEVDGSVPYLSFLWDGTDQGDRADVQVGMTVLVSTTTDYQTTTIFRGRVRLAPDATTFYINETSVNLEDTYYITVLDDYDLHERLEQRISSGSSLIAYKDGSIAFTELPPTISNLQSTYADVSGDATVTISFAPDVAAQAAGATISSYLWDVGDGSITVGVSTDKDITVQFPGAATNEHRWVRFEATDSNGTTQYFVFNVFTVDRSEASPTLVLLQADQLNITATVTEGFNATVRAWDGVSSVLDQTRVAIVSHDDYNGLKALAFTSGGTYEVLIDDTITGATGGATATVKTIDLDSGTWGGGDAAGTLWVNSQSGTFEAENLNVGANNDVATIAADSINTPITQNVSFVGRLRTESSNVRGDVTHSVLQETTFNIEGFLTQLARTKGPGLYLTTATSPTAWGQIQTMTVGRAIVYMLAWHTTFLNLCSFTLPSDIADYEWPDFEIPAEPGAVNWIHSVANNINAWLTLAASGETTIQRHASYAGVSGLTTVLDMVVGNASGQSDLDDWTIDFDYVPTNAQALAGAATYNTTTSEVDVYQGRAPAQQFGPGWSMAPLNAQIMKDSLTQSEAFIETGERVASHLAYTNPHEMLTGTVKDGLYWMVPTYHQLYTFTIAATANTRGRAYTTDDKWMLNKLNYTHNPATGRYPATASWEIVTTGGNYGIVVTQVVDVNDLGYPALPALGAGIAAIDPLANYPVDDPDYTLPGLGAGDTQPGNPEQVKVGCDLLNVSMKTGSSVATKNNSVFGETYVVQVEGDGIISSDDWYAKFDFTVGQAGFAVGEAGSYALGDGFSAEPFYPVGLDDTRFISALMNITGSTSMTRMRLTVSDFTPGTWNGATTLWAVAFDQDFGSPLATFAQASANGAHVYELVTNSTLSTSIRFDSRCARGGVNGNVTISKFELWGTGTPSTEIQTNATTYTEGEIWGDAYYLNYQSGGAELYDSLKGFRIDSAKPASIPTYSPVHIYQTIATGTGSPIVFDYNDSDYTDNANRLLVVTICGPGMALTAL